MRLTKTEGFCDVIDRLVVDQAACPLLKEQGVLEAGITHAGSGWCFVRPAPVYGLVIATISGTGLVVCNDGWQEAGRESVYIMPPGMAHGYRVCQRAREWKYAWAKFETTEMCPELFRHKTPALLSAASYSLEAAIGGLFTEVTRGNSPQLVGIWCDLIRASLTNLTDRRTSYSRIEKLWVMVARRLEENRDLETLAAEAHVSREHLRRLCQQHYGCSPRHRLTQLRLRKSCELLLLTDNTLEMIAERVGFSDAFCFSKAFAREYGASPSKYREKARAAAKESGMV
ncbi:AraC family transcriptional regulator [Opitutaceae bacterium TAV5]|nr:AraC family transcriptional regulator [Opitutaceae bacterium TAV5]